MFVGELGQYYKQKLTQGREEVGVEGHIEASKNIGWL